MHSLVQQSFRLTNTLCHDRDFALFIAGTKSQHRPFLANLALVKLFTTLCFSHRVHFDNEMQ